MAGLALALELLTKTGTLHNGCIHSVASMSAVSAAAAAVAFLPCYPNSGFDTLSGRGLGVVAYCDWNAGRDILAREDSTSWELYHSQKPYLIEPKPIFSAFGLRAISGTTIRALLVSFQPILENYMEQLKTEDDEQMEDSYQPPQKSPIDHAAALKASARYITREVTVVTTRRLLERVVIYKATKRVAWKLLKDLAKSAERKARRNLGHIQFFAAVAKTTFRGMVLGVAANWLVQFGMDIYRYVQEIQVEKEATLDDAKDNTEKLRRLSRRIGGSTLKNGGSLLFGSLGAGAGALLIRPTFGQWIGCSMGEIAGGVIVGIWIDTWIIYGTSSPPKSSDS